MAVGENIQKCRKALGMSQAELGEKLMVTRQTVSLWETGQTAPTIENLLRLKELFGITVDELLDDGPASEPAPVETYRFQFEEAELQEFHRLKRREDCKALYRFFPAGILTLVLLLGARVPWPWVAAALILFLCGGIPRLMALRRYEKSFQSNIARICATTYEYRLFDGYYLLTLYRDGEKVRESQRSFTEIESLKSLGEFLVLQEGGQYLILRKRDLQENSAFYSYLYHHPENPKALPAPGWRGMLANALFVLSLLSIYGALALVNKVSESPTDTTKNMWLFFLFTPIPIASAAVGFLWKARGYRYKKNVVAGIFMTVLLCLYGLFTFLFP